MPADQSCPSARPGRIIGSAAAPSNAAAGLAGPGRLSADCRTWLKADERLEELARRWSEAESELLGLHKRSRHPGNEALLRRLERQIARLDRARSGLLGRIASAPANSPREAIDKLRVAQRLLEGEGGSEHEIVADVLRSLASSFRSDDGVPAPV